MSPSTPTYALPYPAESDTADVPRDMQALAQRVETVLPTLPGVPTGTGLDFYGATAPTGYIFCDGSAVSRTTYAALFAVLSTTYGAGDGSTTFNVPDARGRGTVGLGTHTDVATRGATEGAALANRRPRHPHSSALTAGHNLSLPDHWHNISDPGHRHPIYNSQFATAGGSVFVNSQGNQGSGTQTDYGNTPAAGVGITVTSPQSFPAINGGVSIGGTIGLAGMASDSQAYIVCNKIIKT